MFRQKKYLQNLTVAGDNIFSYETHVAIIDHDKRIVKKLGWWSVTTSKHINYVAEELNYKVVDNTETIKNVENVTA